jgi:Carbohydrate family 9 binding domain-like
MGLADRRQPGQLKREPSARRRLLSRQRAEGSQKSGRKINRGSFIMRSLLVLALAVTFVAAMAGSSKPKEYVCYRAAGKIVIDGKLDEPSWRDAPATDKFVDIEGDIRPHPRFTTRAKMLWDDQYFYIGADLEEPHVWATLTKRDSVIFHDNDFEVFIDPNGDRDEYYELEINALNTAWDLFLPKPYIDGGKAQNSWDIAGLKTAVEVTGTLNDTTDLDKGWSVEMAIPWKALAEYAHKPAPPKDGDQWRINFSRVEWRHEIVDGKYSKISNTKEDNWVWSPQGVIDMHRPEMWGYVRFSTIVNLR